MMRRVKVIYSELGTQEYGFYQAYLQNFIQQDITIISHTERIIRSAFSSCTTIIYECNDDFIDTTGAATVKLKTSFKGQLIIKNIEKGI